jgi:diphosphomevalonate decarboxylase
MNYSRKYKKEAKRFRTIHTILTGTACWESPSNIALIKYWGKKNIQLPKNPSLSFTLDKSFTKTRVNFNFNQRNRDNKFTFLINGSENQRFEERIAAYLGTLEEYFPFLKYTKLNIISENNFPHSAGIASSASAFSALALCLTDIEYQLKNLGNRNNDFLAKASFIARLGSGSAARSVYGGAVLWGRTRRFKKSSDEIAIPVKVNDVFHDYHDLVLIVDDSTKEVSSSRGHELMNNNPFRKERFKQACLNLEQLLEIMKSGDTKGFSELVEYEALSLHAMMMTSLPGNVLINPNTLAVLKKIREYRAKRSVPVAFTLDAGANVHILFPGTHVHEVLKFVNEELLNFSPEHRYILNKLGSGPKKII